LALIFTSPIFDKKEDCKENPFVFEKTNLKKKSPNDYPDIRKSGILAKMKNKNQGENGESASDPAQNKNAAPDLSNPGAPNDSADG